MSGALVPAPFNGGPSHGGNRSGAAPHPMAAALAPSAPTLAGVPAGALFAVAQLAPQSPPGLAAVRIRPADADGRVVIEALQTAVVCAIETDGEAVRPVCLPRKAVLSLKRRHPEAEWLTVSDAAPVLRLASLSLAAAVALTCPEAEPLPAVPLPSPEAETAADRPALLLDPALLARCLGVIEAMGAGPAELRWIHGHPSIGLCVRPSPVAEISGGIWVCRCLLTEAQAQRQRLAYLDGLREPRG